MLGKQTRTVRVVEQLSCRENLDDEFSQIRELVERRLLEVEASESEPIQRGERNDTPEELGVGFHTDLH